MTLALILIPIVNLLKNLKQVLLYMLVGQYLQNLATTDCHDSATQSPIFWKNIHKLWFGGGLHAFWLRNWLLAIAEHKGDEGCQPTTRDVLAKCFVQYRCFISTVQQLWKRYSEATDRDISRSTSQRKAPVRPATSLNSLQDNCAEDEQNIVCLCHGTRSEGVRLINGGWMGCDPCQHVDCFYIGQPALPIHFCHQHEEISHLNYA